MLLEQNVAVIYGAGGPIGTGTITPTELNISCETLVDWIRPRDDCSTQARDGASRRAERQGGVLTYLCHSARHEAPSHSLAQGTSLPLI